MDVKLEEALTEEMRVVLHDLVQSATACEWCAERCVDEGPEMAECLRRCRDVADLATLNVRLLARDSVVGPEAIEVFASAAEACARECARHGHRHCQACAEELSRAVQSTRKMLASFDREGGSAPGRAPGGQPFDRSRDQGVSEPPGRQARLPVEGGGQGGRPNEPRQAEEEPADPSRGRSHRREYGRGGRRAREYERGPEREHHRGPRREYERERGPEREYERGPEWAFDRRRERGGNPDREFDRHRGREYDPRESDRSREREYGQGQPDG